MQTTQSQDTGCESNTGQEEITIRLTAEGDIISVSFGERTVTEPMQNLNDRPYTDGFLNGIETFHLLTFAVENDGKRMLRRCVHRGNCDVYCG